MGLALPKITLVSSRRMDRTMRIDLPFAFGHILDPQRGKGLNVAAESHVSNTSHELSKQVAQLRR